MKTREIAEMVGGTLVGDTEREIVRVADLPAAGHSEAAFLEKGDLPSSKAGCVFVAAESPGIDGTTVIKVKNPKLAFARLAAELHPPKKRKPEIHPSAVISETAAIGRDVFIGAFACVGARSCGPGLR